MHVELLHLSTLPHHLRDSGEDSVAKVAVGRLALCSLFQLAPLSLCSGALLKPPSHPVRFPRPLSGRSLSPSQRRWCTYEAVCCLLLSIHLRMPIPCMCIHHTPGYLMWHSHRKRTEKEKGENVGMKRGKTPFSDCSKRLSVLLSAACRPLWLC